MTDNTIGIKRNIDIVFCLDGTGSMAPCIESVKSNARRFRLEFTNEMSGNGSIVDMMRIKVIVFRDFHDDGANALVESPFYELPGDEADYEKFLTDIVATGGGDGPENGQEALYKAMLSDFTTGVKDRQVIVLFSDADALDLRARASEPNYPADMVDDVGLIETWSCIGDKAQDSRFKLRDHNKRLVIFAPAGTKYEKLKGALDRSIFTPVDMSKGLGDIDFSSIIKIIAASASK